MTLTARPAVARAKVVLVGVFPPPVHGAALVNAAVGELLARSNMAMVPLDVSPRSLGRGFPERLSRAPRVLTALARFSRLCLLRRVDALYLGMSGSIGQLYDLAFVAIARVFGCRICLHHHSFSYIDQHRWYSNWLFALAGSNASHVILCDRMLRGLEASYGRPVRAIRVSNAVWTPDPGAANVRTKIGRIGYFGNISGEKGIWQFLDIARNPAFRHLVFVVGGVFHDKEVESRFTRDLQELANVRYVGPRFGVEKDRFFREIDVLVFPSRYAHEAEPLTVLEALARGVPVIATRRGCLECLLPAAVGKVGPEHQFVEFAISAIESWLENPTQFQSASAAAVAEFRDGRRRAEDGLRDLVGALQP